MSFGLVASSSAAAGGARAFLVHSSLDGKQVLPIRIHWTATTNIPASQVSHVDYLVDGRKAWTEHHPPYYYGGDDGRNVNSLVTTWLSPGFHTFTVVAVSTDGATATDVV